MAETFADLGLRPELVEATRGVGFAAPTSLQRAAIPVLRRGGNAVLHASAGSGVVAAYGLGILDRLAGAEAEPGGARAPASPPRALVLAPTPDAATRVAAALGLLARGTGLRAVALAPGWRSPQDAAIAVAAPEIALTAVERSVLKLEGLTCFVVDGLAAMLSLDADALETVTASVPREAQRVVASAQLTGAAQDYVERHVRRAFHIPPRPAEAPVPPPAPVGTVRYAVVGEPDRLEFLARLLASEAGARRLFCRTQARARALADGLEVRGFSATIGGTADAPVVTLGDGPGAPDAAISYDVPFDAAALTQRHRGGGLVLVDAAELPHLRRIANEANLALQPETRAIVGGDDLAAYRERLRRALAEEDIAAQLLVLEPLFGESSAAEVAAAASALLRRRAPAEPAAAAPTPGAAPRAWVRLFMSVGQRDGTRPGDVMGAVTGEAGVKGDQIGRIEIRDTFSIVEVAAEIAERVIQAMNGTTLKGRSLRVDYDRRPPASPGRARPPR
ncbi:MAG: DEAD/DEAH box helicase [Gemmatimonadetes bacterium]|nr:DEAD/DEAH box helicase [Gemmatimonadota bacterium]